MAHGHAHVLLHITHSPLVVEEVDASFRELAIVEPKVEVLGQSNRCFCLENVALER